MREKTGEKEAHKRMGGRPHQAERAFGQGRGESASLELRVPLSVHTKASGAQELMFPDTRPLISCPNPLPHVHQQPPGSHVGLHKRSPWCTECLTPKLMWSSRTRRKCRHTHSRLKCNTKLLSPAVSLNASHHMCIHQHSIFILIQPALASVGIDCRSISHTLQNSQSEVLALEFRKEFKEFQKQDRKPSSK